MASKVKELQEGDAAPEISLEDDNGERFRLSDLKGQEAIVYFYPKSDTPGCTTEACAFRDEFAHLKKRKAAVIGISPDTVAAQAKFKAKYQLPFKLLADREHTAAQAFGVWTEKSMYGRKYMGVERTTFIIGADGKIKKIFRKVKPAGHAAEVLAGL
jgi:peroxiredoxin Q/BCP